MSDDMKHKAEELVGKAKAFLGDKTDDDSMQAEGESEQTKANLKQAGDKVKDAFNG